MPRLFPAIVAVLLVPLLVSTAHAVAYNLATPIFADVDPVTLNIDVQDVARGIGLDNRIGAKFLHAGPGYGGSCFPKDVTALKQLAGNSGYHFQLLNSVIEVNELQKRRVIGKLQRHLGKLRGKRVALLGLAFKAGTDDTREAPSRDAHLQRLVLDAAAEVMNLVDDQKIGLELRRAREHVGRAAGWRGRLRRGLAGCGFLK
mgnify:CR=1 FL=1